MPRRAANQASRSKSPAAAKKASSARKPKSAATSEEAGDDYLFVNDFTAFLCAFLFAGACACCRAAATNDED